MESIIREFIVDYFVSNGFFLAIVNMDLLKDDPLYCSY